MKIDPKIIIEFVKAILHAIANGGKITFKSVLNILKVQTIKFLKTSAVKFALKKILGSAVAGGFLGFIITYVVEELFEEVAEPLIKLAFRKLGYVYDRADGEVRIKKLHRANQDGREGDADRQLDNI